MQISSLARNMRNHHSYVSQAKINFNKDSTHGFITEDMRVIKQVRLKNPLSLDPFLNTDRVIEGLKTYRKHNPHVDMRNICVYVPRTLTRVEEDMKRIRRLQETDEPDVRIYLRYRTKLTRDLHGVHNRAITGHAGFMEYIPRSDEKQSKKLFK